MTYEPKRPRGRPPKDKATTEPLPEWDGVVRGPALPRSNAGGPSDGWCKATTEWWTAYRCSPQAMLMSETDWHNLKNGAYIHHRLHRNQAEDLSPTAHVNLS